jgi:small subunit ribosomal protein S7
MRGRPYLAKRKINPDPKYLSVIVAKFINYLMTGGKKTTAQKVIYEAFDYIKNKTKKEPLALFETAMRNVTPMVEIRPRRVGGSNYQVPFPVSTERGFTLASRWLIDAARAQKGRPMFQKLGDELIAASENQGSAIKKRDDTHRMAEANRAFAHFARFTR